MPKFKLPDLLELPANQLNAMLARLHGWTDDAIAKAAQLAELEQQWRRLPRKDSFSGLDVAQRIERLQSQGAQPLPPFWRSRDACATVRSMRVNTPALQKAYVKHLSEVLRTVAQEKSPLTKKKKIAEPTTYELVDAFSKYQLVALILTLQP